MFTYKHSQYLSMNQKKIFFNQKSQLIKTFFHLNREEVWENLGIDQFHHHFLPRYQRMSVVLHHPHRLLPLCQHNWTKKIRIWDINNCTPFHTNLVVHIFVRGLNFVTYAWNQQLIPLAYFHHHLFLACYCYPPKFQNVMLKQSNGIGQEYCSLRIWPIQRNGQIRCVVWKRDSA